MKKSKPVWKQFIVIAAVAFVLGLLPYFFTLPGSLAQGVPFSVYLGELASWLWNLVVRYAPHILTVYIIGVAALIFFEGQNPDRTILWLLTLALLPVVGIVLYVLLGPDLKHLQNRKLFKPTKCYPTLNLPRGVHVSANVGKMATLGYRTSGADILERGAVDILIDGQETFAAIKEALRSATRFIHIEYFIYKDDRLGREIAQILCERASAGVTVRMTVDGVGSRKLGRRLIRQLEQAGVHFKTFMPVSFPVLHSGINFRNHRKIVVVDGNVAFTGGLNVGVDYLGEGYLGNWRDTHARFRGEAVEALNGVFLQDWKIASGETFSCNAPEFAPTDPEEMARLPFFPMQIVASGSSSPWHAIGQMYFTMIMQATRRIWITSPYLVPDAPIFEALQTAALSGVDVRLLIPAKSDHFLVYWAGRSNIEDLLRAGVRIWRYTNGFLHAKTLLMDDTVASVGTANLDNRSLEINFEVQAFLYDRNVCKSFERDFLIDIRDAEECVLSEWERRSVGVKILESLGRLWSSQI